MGTSGGRDPLGLAGWQLTAAGALLVVPAFFVDGVPKRIDGPAWAGWGSWVACSPARLRALIAGERPTVIQLAGFALALVALGAGQFRQSA